MTQPGIQPWFPGPLVNIASEQNNNKYLSDGNTRHSVNITTKIVSHNLRDKVASIKMVTAAKLIEFGP